MTRDETLDEAKRLITGDRQEAYGDPAVLFQRVANLWNGYLGGVSLTPHDVAMCLALLKVARVRASADREDSYVDGAGYLALAAELAGAPGA